MILLAKRRFQAGHQPVWNCGKNISKTRWRQWRKQCWENPTKVGIWFHRLSLPALCRRIGLQHRWREDFAKDVGRVLLGGRLALPRPIGCCALAHNVWRLERPEEVRAARRALVLSHQEGALCLLKGSGVEALCSCGDAQGMCFDGHTVAQKARIGTLTANRGPKVKAFLRPIIGLNW